LRDGEAASWESWSQWLPGERVTTAHVAQSGTPGPYSVAQAGGSGWLRRVPLHGAAALAVYSGQGADDEQLLAQFGSALTRSEAFRPGRRRAAWLKNCVAVGPAAVCIEPVAVSSFHLLCADTERLLRMLPAPTESASVAAEFNRVAASTADRARDLAIAHFRLNGRFGDEYWDRCRGVELPEQLAYKLTQFESRGRMVMNDDEPVLDQAWINLLDEFGVQPRRYDPLADGFAVEQLQQHMQRARELMLAELRTLPSHGDYLQGLARQQPGSVGA
jgi:tryptophan halogenase